MNGPLPAWRDLLAVARFAPSPHNTQPWRLRPTSESTASLFIERARMLPDEDTTGCFIRCAMGMFVECLSIAAANAGCRLEVEQAPEAQSAGNGLDVFAHVRLVADSNVRAEFANRSILDRRTSRLHPEPRLVSDEALARIEHIAASGGQAFAHCFDHARIHRLLAVNLDAIVHDLNDPRYGHEISLWFRYGERHSAATNDGLDSRCMAIPAHELKIAAKAPALMRWPVTGPVMRALYRRRLGPALHLGMLAGPFFEPGVALSSGRCLMRVWLTLHDLGLSIHPFGNMVTNPKAHEWMTREFGLDRIWLVFRMGYTPRPPASRRLDVERILC